jgi:hypothetical protein
MATDEDDKIFQRIQSFERDRVSQVLLIEGTQGVGKTNLLSWYEAELRDAYRDEPSYYIVRYFMDPEPSFDGILRRLFQELGVAHIQQLAGALSRLNERQRELGIEVARGHDFRKVMHSLSKAAQPNQDLASIAELALEWLIGLRVLNKHRDALGVMYRLDTVEAKTQALRDLVHVSAHLGLLKAIFLLLDELEKQDYSVSKTILLRYLSAIRAIIDALPRYLFMMVALTPEARRRYFEMLPAFQGRLQNIIALQPLKDQEAAVRLFRFYLDAASRRAADAMNSVEKGRESLIGDQQVRTMFAERYRAASQRGTEGVTQRDFLNALHDAAEHQLKQAS